MPQLMPKTYSNHSLTLVKSFVIYFCSLFQRTYPTITQLADVAP